MTALIQKRMVALNRGARALVDLQTKDLMQIVVAEIMGDKIYLDATGNLKAVEDDSALVDKLDRLLAEDGGPGIAPGHVPQHARHQADVLEHLAVVAQDHFVFGAAIDEFEQPLGQALLCHVTQVEYVLCVSRIRKKHGPSLGH